MLTLNGGIRMYFRNLIICLASTFLLVGFVRFTFDGEEEIRPVPRSRILGIKLVKLATPPKMQLGCVGELEKELVRSAIESRLDPKLLLAMIQVESGCNHQARSPKGAIGFMQVLPSTAKLMGIDNPTTGSENIKAGARYLRAMQDQFNSDIRLSLAAYNAGPAAVKRYRGVPPYRETQNYVRNVLRIYGELSRSAI